MKVLAYILICSVFVINTQAQEAEKKAEGTIEDEAWVLRPPKPTQEERLKEENTQWMLETSARHWSGKGEMTPEELDKLRSIYRNKDGKQKIDAFSIITFVEGIENWEGDLVQMLYSNERAYVQSGLNVLSAKMLKGSEHEKSVLASNQAITSRVNDLGSLWVEDSNIQGKVKQFQLALDQFHATRPSKEIGMETLNVEEVAEVVEEIAAAPEPTIEKPVKVVVSEPTEKDIEQSSNWWLWLIGLVVIVGGVFVLRSKK